MTLPTQMTVIEMREAGGPDVLVTGKRDVPQPRADEVLIKVIAAGVNGPDLVHAVAITRRQKARLTYWVLKYQAKSLPSARRKRNGRSATMFAP